MSKKTQFIPSGAISSTPNMASARIPLPHYLDISAITFGSVKKDNANEQIFLQNVSGSDNLMLTSKDQDIECMKARDNQFHYLLVKHDHQYALFTKSIKWLMYGLWNEMEMCRKSSTRLHMTLCDIHSKTTQSHLLLQEDNLQQAVLNLTAFLEEYQPMSLAVDACRHKILVENCTSINKAFDEELRECLSLVESILTQLMKRKAISQIAGKVVSLHCVSHRSQCAISKLWEVMQELMQCQASFTSHFIHLKNILSNQYKR